MRIAVEKGKGKGGVKVVKVEAEREEEKEVIIRRKIVFLRWKPWNYDNFSRGWGKKYPV